MKIKYLSFLVILFSQLSFSQTMTLHKTDQTKLDFQLARVDSITFSTGPESTSLDINKENDFSKIELASRSKDASQESPNIEASNANSVKNKDLSKTYNKEKAVLDVAIIEKNKVWQQNGKNEY
jgi:hypothetical protein